MKIYILLTFALSITVIASSQIVYTDIIPDDTLITDYVTDSKWIDFNGDFSPELVIFSTKKDTVISGFDVTLTGIAISTLGNTGIIATIATIGNEDVVIADTIPVGGLIGSSSTYLNSTTPSVFAGVGLGVQSDFFGIGVGDFMNNGTLCFGVEFEISTNVHYGWVRVNIDTLASSGIIYDLAYESTANTSIGAGETSSGFMNLSNQTLNDINIFTSNKSLYFESENALGKLTVCDLLGKKVKQINVMNNKVIDVKDLNTGIYLVSFTDGISTITKKVFIE